MGIRGGHFGGPYSAHCIPMPAWFGFPHPVRLAGLRSHRKRLGRKHDWLRSDSWGRWPDSSGGGDSYNAMRKSGLREAQCQPRSRQWTADRARAGPQQGRLCLGCPQLPPRCLWNDILHLSPLRWGSKTAISKKPEEINFLFFLDFCF